MKKRGLFLLLCLLCLGICAACSGRERVEGEITGFELDEDGQLASFTIRLFNGKEREFILTEESHVSSFLGDINRDDFLSGPQPGTEVEVFREKRGTAWHVYITGRLERNAASLSDGMPLDIMRHWLNGYTYRLTDGTELLRVRESGGPDAFLGNELLDALSEAAQEKILAYYEAQGLLYDEKAELERAYAAWREEGEKYQCRLLDQYSLFVASSDRVVYFMTSVYLPVEGRTYEELRLGAAFDRETGEHINNLDLFNCPKEKAIEAILDTAVISTQLLYEEMRAAFQPENLVFFSSDLELMFPQGTLPSEEYAYYLSVEYDGALREVLHDWAIPDPN